jgi:predicted NUDIX family phosphoesterase
MGHFLDIARTILEETKEPLSAQEIVELAKARGLLVSKGKAPDEIMKSKLSTNILNKKESSPFMRTEKGKFALRAWKGDFEEYVADRFQKALMNEHIAVFPASSLYKYIKGRGFYLTPIENSQELIAECRPMLRTQAETDYNMIQLISVFIVRVGDKYLTYKRTKRLPEERLHGYYSIIFGGHLNLKDILPLFNVFSTDYANLEPIRELEEEVRWPKKELPDITYKGLLYDDSRDVSRQHLGIVYDVYLKSATYQIGERGFLMDPKIETLSEIENRINDFENWSVLIVEHERKERQ